MLPFCEPGDSNSVLWVENGLSRCFSDILGSLSAGGVLFLIGLTVLTLSEKTKTKRPLPWLPLSQSKLFIAEIVASCIYALTFAADLILKGCLVGEESVEKFSVFALCIESMVNGSALPQNILSP